METAAVTMADVIAASGDVISLLPKIFAAITGNPLLMFYLAGGVISAGIGWFGRLKGAAMH